MLVLALQALGKPLLLHLQLGHLLHLPPRHLLQIGHICLLQPLTLPVIVQGVFFNWDPLKVFR